MARIRKRKVRPLLLDKTAFAYVRCGLPDSWEEKYLATDTYFISRANHNEWVNAQWAQVRRYARHHDLELRKRFFEVEGTPTCLNSPLPLPRREQLAKLLVEATRLRVRTILVDHRNRL